MSWLLWVIAAPPALKAAGRFCHPLPPPGWTVRKKICAFPPDPLPYGQKVRWVGNLRYGAVAAVAAVRIPLPMTPSGIIPGLGREDRHDVASFVPEAFKRL